MTVGNEADDKATGGGATGEAVGNETDNEATGGEAIGEATDESEITCGGKGGCCGGC